MQIGVVGGTGPAGRALASRLAAGGAEVLLGSRSAERGEEIAAELRHKWPDRKLELVGVANETAASAGVVVLATPFEAAAETVLDLAEALSGKVVISMVNALVRVGGELQALLPARGSVAAMLQAALPESAVTAAFQHLPARALAAIDRELRADVLVCADTPDGLAATVAVVEVMPGLRAVHAGSLASAGAVEALAAVLVNVNVSYRSHVAVQLTGLRERGA
ncbi:MAG: oxidoreductase coenzyme F420-dependent [Acidimicrobiaceae bacterium]|nr:oxidoreductase coenzyme F420-dependent [Acidimicrobiaceae bacterium]